MWITSAQTVVNNMQKMMIFALNVEKKETGKMMIMMKTQAAPTIQTNLINMVRG